MSSDIIVVGLGQSWGQVTGEAREVLNRARADHLYLRTAHHPAIAHLPRAVTEQAYSFDPLYQANPALDSIQTEIAAQLIAAAQNSAGQPIIYAVPGHPMVGEASVQRLLTRAEVLGIKVRIIAGVSFIEPLCTALRLDPLAMGMQIADATALAAELAQGEGEIERDWYFSRFRLPFSGSKLPTLLSLSPHLPLLLSQVYPGAVAEAVGRGLGELYPPTHLVSLVRAAGSDEQQVVQLPLGELAEAEILGPLTCLYVPPLPALAATRSLDTLVYITGRLQGPNGCPWDREQTHQSIKQNLIEETYEAVEALDALAADTAGAHRGENLDKFAEELGDVLLQVVFQSQMATMSGEFTLGDVAEHISRKLMRRHPHVFGDVQVSGSGEVLQNWEEIKRAERAAKASPSEGPPLETSEGLKGVSRQLPALHYAQEIQSRVARVGFDWPDVQGVLDKIAEEVREINEADSDHQREEFGDLLFAMANLGRWLGLDSEEALRLASQKFIRRFAALEGKAVAQGQRLSEMSLAEMDALWDEAKRDERSRGADLSRQSPNMDVGAQIYRAQQKGRLKVVVVKVMVVDDATVIRQAVTKALQFAGIEVVASVPDAVSALEAAAEYQPDVTITDLHMPGGDGDTLAAELLKHGLTRYVVVMSVDNSKQTRERAANADAVLFLDKCASITELVARLQQVICGVDCPKHRLVSSKAHRVGAPRFGLRDGVESAKAWG